MALNDFVSQMILLVFTILAGVATWLATRKRRTADESTPATASEQPARATIFNGYAALLERTLERAQRLEERNRDLETHANELEEYVAELKRQIDEMRRKQRTRRATPTPRKHTAS